MRRLFTLLLLILPAAAQTTPNLNFNVPVPGTLNWGNGINQNFYSLDSILSGGTPLPGFNLPSVANVNQVLNPNVCSTSVPASWCAGSDMGAWINSALTQFSNKCGEVYVPTGTYSFTTPIFISRCTRLRGAGANNTILNYTPTTGWAIIMANAGAGNEYPEGAIEDFAIKGPGASNLCGFIYIGGSDGAAANTYSPVASPSTAVNPGSNFGDHFSINRVHVGLQGFGCGVGIQIGTNAFNDTLFESDVVTNGIGFLVPAVTSNSGEALYISGSTIHNSVNTVPGNCGGVTCAGDGIYIGSQAGGNTDVIISGGSVDYNAGWSIHNGETGQPSQNLVDVHGAHIESFAQWARCAGTCIFSGVQFNNGSTCGSPNYLLDGEMGTNGNFIFIGGWMHNNSGSCPLFNPAGTRPIVIAVTSNSNLATYYATLLPLSSGVLTQGGGTFGAAVSVTGTGSFSSSLVATGTQATLSGTGACATRASQSGGSWSGNVQCTGTTGASTITITPGNTAPAGMSCSGSDNTTGHELAGAQSGGANTACTLKFSSVTANDFVSFTVNSF